MTLTGLEVWNDHPELQNHPLWWCDYLWDPATCPHPSVSSANLMDAAGYMLTYSSECDACGKRFT